MLISPGDNLEPLMVGIGWSATQGGVDAAKVNLYFYEMAHGNWQWLPVNRRNPILIDQTGKIMSGHHRLIAARIAGVIVPEAALQRFPGNTSRPSTSWRDVVVRRDKIGHRNMGFEAYTVRLTPCSTFPLVTGHRTASVQSLVSELRQEWPDIHPDEEELRCRPYPPKQEETFLVYETTLGLFQIMLSLYQEQVTASVRFAYCNPRSVYRPFTSVIAWLMGRYGMHGSTMASDRSQELNDPQEVLTVLTPSMDYNRLLWQLDAGTSEEAILSPGQSMERFILPQCLSTSPA